MKKILMILNLNRARMAMVPLLIIALAFFACDDGKDTHTHTWSDWQSNAEQHWKECSCGEKTDISNHTGNPCTVCGYEEIATVPQPTQKILSFGKIIVSSEDQYISSEWNDLLDSLVSSLETMYDEGDDDDQMVFSDPLAFGGVGLKIVLKNDLAKNWEVKKTLPEGEGVKGTLYIKTDSIGSISTSSYAMAILAVAANNPQTSLN